eukprot:TRINITY_DN6706_c0_g2_i2.p1 TRINITY_DN6706_c0_g2~~TRINITY_DN6706_c0_g2_i2.p1  ORF type:complete len:285 (-),score=54.77 TRINITY_DN6706_c0_g2_i2:117-911(-)
MCIRDRSTWGISFRIMGNACNCAERKSDSVTISPQEQTTPGLFQQTKESLSCNNTPPKVVKKRWSFDVTRDSDELSSARTSDISIKSNSYFSITLEFNRRPRSESDLTWGSRLMKSCLTLNDGEESYAEALLAAVNDSDLSALKKCIQKGYPLDRPISEEGFFPLHVACKKGDPLLIDFLLANGAEVNGQDQFERWTPLMICSLNGHDECVAYLLSKGADVNLKSEECLTALDYAQLALRRVSNNDRLKRRLEQIIRMLESPVF